MARTAIACKQQTLPANRLADRICCFYDGQMHWPTRGATSSWYCLVAIYTANNAKLQKPGAKSAVSDCILLLTSLIHLFAVMLQGASERSGRGVPY